MDLAAAAAAMGTMPADAAAAMAAAYVPEPLPMSDYAEIQTIYESPNFEFSINTACFDTCQELFWTGNNDVNLLPVCSIQFAYLY